MPSYSIVPPNPKRWQIRLFLLCQIWFSVWAYWWSRAGHLPPPGYAIALIAVVAAVMSIQGEMKGWQKAFWMLIIAALLRVEFRAINDDRIDSANKQKEFFEAQRKGFEGVTYQAGQNFASTTVDLTTAIDSLKTVVGTTQKAVENVTGGDSYAYVSPQGNGAVIPLSMHNYGKNILSGVSIRILNLQDPNWVSKTQESITIGTLAPFGFAPVPVSITPVPEPQTGIASYWIFIVAQNGTVDEMLQFRKSKTNANSFAYSLSVKRDNFFDASGKQILGPKSVTRLAYFGWSDERIPKR